MYTYNYNASDGLGVFAGLGVLLIILAIIAGAIAITCYVLQGIALSDLAKKNGFDKPWFAWIPVANMYLLGKLGFEYYAPKDKRNSVFTWVLLGCSAASIVLSGDRLGWLATIAMIVFEVMALYYIFKVIKPQSATAYTVLSAIFGIGSIILFFNRKNFVPADGAPAPVQAAPAQAPAKEEKPAKGAKFCPNCGAEVKGNVNFCPKCGNKL